MSAPDIYIPKVKVSPYMRHWWSKELETARAEVAKLARQAYTEGKKGCISHTVHEVHRKAHNLCSEMIKLAKKEHFIEWLERVDPSTIWDLHKFVSVPASERQGKDPNLGGRWWDINRGGQRQREGEATTCNLPHTRAS